MFNISRIEELLFNAQATGHKYEDLIKKNPDSLFYSSALKSTQNHINDLTEQLVLQKKKRELEIIELRLKGKSAELGKLSLEIFGNVSKALADCLVEASRFVQFGNKSGTNVISIIRQTIDLKFIGIAAGSTKVLISANTNPDLFGNSIIEKALVNTFEVLNAADSESLIDRSNTFGNQSIKKLNSFLNTVTKSELDFDLSWESPSSKSWTWSGSKEKIITLSNSLSSIKVNDPQEIEFSGVLEMQSIRGIIEITDEGDKHYRATFPGDLLDRVRNIQIGATCSGILIARTTTNTVTKQEKVHFELQDINSA